MSQVTIGMPLYEGCTLLDFVGATEVFRWAGGYNVLWLSTDLNPVATTSDARVLPHKRFADALAGETKIDTLFIPGGGDAVAKTMFDTNYIGFLQGIAPRCAWVGYMHRGLSSSNSRSTGRLQSHHLLEPDRKSSVISQSVR